MFQTEMAIMDVDYGHQMHYCLTQLRQINRKLETIERLFDMLYLEGYFDTRQPLSQVGR